MQEAALYAIATLVKENKTVAQVLEQPMPQKREWHFYIRGTGTNGLSSLKLHRRYLRWLRIILRTENLKSDSLLAYGESNFFTIQILLSLIEAVNKCYEHSSDAAPAS